MTSNIDYNKLLRHNLGRTTWDLVLNLMDLAILTCRLAESSSDLDRIEAQLHRAKSFYARVVGKSSRYLLTPQDVGRLELSCARLEQQISRLEGRLRKRPAPPPFRWNAERYL